MIRVIYFDYHGVLDRRTFDGMLNVIGQTANPVEASNISTAIRQTGYAYATGRLSPHIFWHQLESQYGQAASRAGRDYILHVEPIRDTWNMVSTLHERYELGLCSDCALDQKEVIRSAYALTDYFDFLIFSCDVQSCKRDAEFYRLMLQHGRFQPNECLLIDDIAANTGLADSLGFQTHTYRDPATLESYLSTL
jgi:FMN phosphatase YigB (HAD superfamily)